MEVIPRFSMTRMDRSFSGRALAMTRWKRKVWKPQKPRCCVYTKPFEHTTRIPFGNCGHALYSSRRKSPLQDLPFPDVNWPRALLLKTEGAAPRSSFP